MVLLFIQLDFFFFFQWHETDLGTSELKPNKQKGKKKLSFLNTQVQYNSTLPGHSSNRLKQKPISYAPSGGQLLVLKNQSIWN